MSKCRQIECDVCPNLSVDGRCLLEVDGSDLFLACSEDCAYYQQIAGGYEYCTFWKKCLYDMDIDDDCHYCFYPAEGVKENV